MGFGVTHPGQLDQLVRLQTFAATADGGGGQTRAWSDFATDADVWAYVSPLRGSEGVQDGAHNATGMWLFTIYNRSDVSELDRIVWDGVPYNIQRVMRKGTQPIYLNIEAERGVAQ